MFENVTFAYPYILFGLVIIPFMVFLYFFKWKKKIPVINYSNTEIFNELKPTLKGRLKDVPFILRIIAIALLIIAAARPQTFSSGENIYTEGIDVAMVLDISGSMLAEDFKPNRLEAAKNVIDEFVSGRTTDKIGLVIFAKESFTQCPLTIDYQVLRGLLTEIKSGMIEDGTAIGNAIANGVNRLKESSAKSKVLIF